MLSLRSRAPYVVGFVVSAGCATCFAAYDGRLSDPDLLSGYLYALGYATVLGASLNTVDSRLVRVGNWFSTLAPIFVGFAIALVWHAFLSAIFGEWLGAIGLPLLLGWILGGVAAGYALTLSHQPSIRLGLAASLISLALVAFVWWRSTQFAPRLIVVFRDDTPVDITDVFFQSVIGNAIADGRRHALKAGITRASILQDGSPRIIEVELRAGLSDAARSSIVSSVLAYAHVRSVRVISRKADYVQFLKAMFLVDGEHKDGRRMLAACREIKNARSGDALHCGRVIARSSPSPPFAAASGKRVSDPRKSSLRFEHPEP